MGQVKSDLRRAGNSCLLVAHAFDSSSDFNHSIFIATCVSLCSFVHFDVLRFQSCRRVCCFGGLFRVVFIVWPNIFIFT